MSLRDAYGLATDGRAQTLGPRSPWASASSPFSAEPAFSAAASFDISANTNSPFGSHQGIRSAVADCSGPIGRETFHSVHVEAARRMAVQAHRAGVERFAHVSGIGADATSPSLYIRKRGEGELAVQAAFTDAILVRPAVMFGPDALTHGFMDKKLFL